MRGAMCPSALGSAPWPRPHRRFDACDPKRASARGKQRPALSSVARQVLDLALTTPGSGRYLGGQTYPTKQCAAVSTQDAATRTPPHRVCPPICNLTSQGQAPGGAALPPTIRPCARVMLAAPRRLSPHGPRMTEAASRGTSCSCPHIEAHPALRPAPLSFFSLTWLREVLEEGGLRFGTSGSC
jgi:hypothetical protein